MQSAAGLSPGGGQGSRGELSTKYILLQSSFMSYKYSVKNASSMQCTAVMYVDAEICRGKKKKSLQRSHQCPPNTFFPSRIRPFFLTLSTMLAIQEGKGGRGKKKKPTFLQNYPVYPCVYSCSRGWKSDGSGYLQTPLRTSTTYGQHLRFFFPSSPNVPAHPCR